MKIISIPVLALLALSAVVSSANTVNDDEDSLSTTSISAADDGGVEETSDSLIAVKADESYRDIVRLKSADTPPEVLYPKIYACFTDNFDVLSRFRPDSPEFARARNVLRDINPDLEAGAFHYSSLNNSAQLTKFAMALLDTQLHPAFAGHAFRRDEQTFPSIVYIAASGAYNSGDFPRAIEYFKLFFTCGDNPMREKVYMYMGQACINAGQYDLAVNSMHDAMKLYPENYHLISFGIKACIDGGHAERLQEFLDAALRMRPDDEQLLSIQGKLLEDEQQYLKALDIYRRLDEMKPNNMSVAQHTALCYYNLGVGFFNQAIMESDEKGAKRLKRQSNDYFSSAIEKLEEVVANIPTSVKYLKALAVAYGCIDDKEKFDELNNRIQALGQDPVAGFSMPPIVAYSEQNTTNYQRAGVASSEAAADAPLYSDFAKDFVEKKLSAWTRKGEFEKIEDYQKRVNDLTIKAEYDKACAEAQAEYLEKYARALRLNDLTLRPYDAGNEVYLIDSSYGPIYLKVPLADNQAELFKSNWAGVHFQAPRFYIADNEVRVAQITFVTPYGKRYTYDTTDNLAYQQQLVDVDFDAILRQANAGQSVAQTARKSEVKITRMSDVDENIPQTTRRLDRTLALIIANENYDNVVAVESALHDGEIFAKYCNLTLGIPQENIRVFKDASLGTMLGAVAQIRNAVQAFDGDCDVIVYYAGHGMPDERTKDAYLLPVDGSPLTPESCMPLGRFYEQIGDAGSGSVIVFLDACFSGARRDGGMLAQARGVAIKPKESAPTGNMLVFSATSGQETALPYRDKNHGLFTYYLLKKIQQTKGDVTLKDLTDDVTANVRRQSAVINNKLQSPQVTASGLLTTTWQNRKLRK